MKQVVIRSMKPQDLEAIVAIDARVRGQQRREYWENKIELLQARSPIASLVADLDGQVVGFILGEASGWEYGVPETTGFVDTIGVDPDYHRKGIARQLIEEMINHFRKVGVTSVATQVDRRDGDLLRFFDKMGFVRGDLIHLELKV